MHLTVHLTVHLDGGGLSKMADGVRMGFGGKLTVAVAVPGFDFGKI